MPLDEPVKTVDAACQADRQWPRHLRLAHYRYQLAAVTSAGEWALWQGAVGVGAMTIRTTSSKVDFHLWHGDDAWVG